METAHVWSHLPLVPHICALSAHCRSFCLSLNILAKCAVSLLTGREAWGGLVVTIVLILFKSDRLEAFYVFWARFDFIITPCVIMIVSILWWVLWCCITFRSLKAACLNIVIPPAQRSCWGGGGGILVSLRPSSVRPSVRPASRVRSVAPTVLVGSISYLYILSSNFRRCVACLLQNCKICIFGNLFKICNFDFDFVLFWLGIWCESLVWVIMGRRRVSQNAGVLVVLVWYAFICSWGRQTFNVESIAFSRWHHKSSRERTKWFR